MDRRRGSPGPEAEAVSPTEIETEDEDDGLSALGDEPADHHSMLFGSDMASSGVPGLNHLSWEVCDVDDIHAGADHLAARKRAHEWGIGRHLLGSQIFDYWRDPWGHIHEHWTDGDQFDSSVPVGDYPFDQGAASQWGPNPPSTFGRTIAPAAR